MNTKRRVLFISRKWPPAIGGMETYSVELVASLEEHFLVTTLVLPGREGGDAPGLLGYGLFVLRAMIYCAINGRRFDGVIFSDLVLFPAAICHWLVAPKARRIVVVYGLDLVYCLRRGLIPFLYRGFFTLFRATQGVFSSIVGISRHTGGLAKASGLRNVSVITPSLPQNDLTGKADVLPPLPGTWRQAAGRRVLYFGRLVPRKGALWFARQVLPHLDENVEFFVVGDSSHATYRAELSRCARTHCLGREPSSVLAQLIKSADAVVMPNIAVPEAIDVEGFGLAAIEATALGGRVLAARIDGISDAIADGRTGTLLPSADPAAWVHAIERLLSVSPSQTAAYRTRVSRETREIYSRANQGRSFKHLLDPIAG